MLTAANVSSEMAVNYFIKNYYHEDLSREEGRLNEPQELSVGQTDQPKSLPSSPGEMRNQGKSRWSGRGAEKLGLSGAVENQKAFKNVISGRTPDGRELLNARVLKPDERRAALDCTFSAPKSVSLIALVGGDERLIKAHHQALKEVIELMEQRYATTRVTTDNGRQRVNTCNLVIAQFDHIESRELDPHLHTHCLLMNTTQTPDGKWMSLVNGEIFANKKFLGMAYQSYLAREVQKLGYEVEHRKHGQFEIKGFKEVDLEAFSKRRQQIIDKGGSNSSWAEREKVWDTTRQRKQKLTESELKFLWKSEAAALGINFVKPRSPNTLIVTPTVKQPHLIDALADAIAHCSESHVAFKQEDLEKFILSQRLATDINAIEPLIEQHQELIALPGIELQYTTVSAVNRELATIELMQQGQGIVNPMSHPEVIKNYLEKTTLNSGQCQAVQLAATTSDQFIAWQGVAGAGKTFALKELKAIALYAGYTVKGLAPSSMAAKVLSEELGIQGETVASLLVGEPSPESLTNQVWIVDEAGLLSAKDAHALLLRATLVGARLLLVGDTKQLSAVEAGNPFKSLQQAGIKTAHLTQSNRQRNPDLKIAVDLISEGRVEAGFKQLETIGSIQEVSADTKLEMIAADYMALSKEQRAQTLVLAGTNVEKLALTGAIRDKLKQEGSLGETTNITQLSAKNLTRVQMRYTHNFEVGDLVMPTRNYKRRSLEKGKLYSVVGKDIDRLILKADSGKQLEVDTNFDKAVYQHDRIEIAVGDRLQWKKNDRQLGRRNGQEFVVKAIEGDNAQIQYLDSGLTETLKLSTAQHLDYAIVSTIYSSQGKTAERALIAADYTIRQESFYVAVSRARHNVKLYTQDKSELLELAQQSLAKENALELLRKQVKQLQQQPQAITINISAEVSSPVLKQQTAASALVFKPIIMSVAPNIKTSLEASTEVPVVKPIKKSTPSGVTTHVFSKPVLKRPLPTEAFWTPDNAPVPDHIDPEHWSELVDGSAIHPLIAALNFKSLHLDFIEQEHQAWEYLMYSSKISRRNDGRLTDGDLRRYAHIESGGWWCQAGVDPRSFPQLELTSQPNQKMWGCYKPNTPRANAQKPGKFIKYEHPPKVELSIFLLDVPPSVAERIYSKHKVNPNQGDRANGFWYCVWKHNIPLTITEGAKKAACLLSHGHAAIGLPGIYAGYRSKDELGEPISPVLHEELAVFATPNRQIQFCFDYETKPKTKLQVEIAIWRTGRLLEQQGAKVLVVTLPGPDKGVDDFIVARGPLAYENLSHDAPTFQDWHRHNQQRAAAIQPPRKLTPEQRLERHKQGTGNGQQPTENDLLDLLISPKLEEIKKAISCSPFPIPCSQQNQSIGQTHDINRQQPNPDTVINREDFGILSENREPRSEQLETNRENRILRKEPNREHERVESQSLELLTGINQYVERKQVEQLGDDIARISQSLTINGLRGQRTTNLSTEVNGQDSAIFDRKASYVHPSQSTNGQLLNAISDYVEQSAISRALTETVLEVTQQLFQYKEQLVTAKATFNDLDTVLATELQSRTEKRAISSISNYVEQSAISRALTETLLEVTQQLSQYKEQLVTAKTAFNDLDAALAAELQFRTEKRAISSISDYVEQSAISRALTETLLEVTQQLSRYKEQLVTAKATFNDLDSLLAAELQSYSNNRAISSIDGEVEPATKETLASTLLGEVKSSLKQIIQGLDEERLAEVVMEVGKYIKSEFMTGEKVNELFTTVTPPNLFLTFEQKMNIVRQLIRDDKPSIMERLRTKFQQSDDDEQIRFRR